MPFPLFAEKIGSLRIIEYYCIIVFVGYAITLAACHHRAISAHQLGHLLAFQAAAYPVAIAVDPFFQLTLGYGIPLPRPAGIVILGGAVLLVLRLVMRLAKRRPVTR